MARNQADPQGAHHTMDDETMPETSGRITPGQAAQMIRRRRVRNAGTSLLTAATVVAGGVGVAGCDDDASILRAGVSECADVDHPDRTVTDHQVNLVNKTDAYQADPLALPQVNGGFKPSGTDGLWQANFGTPDAAVDNASFIGEVKIRGIHYTTECMLLDVEVDDDIDVNRTGSVEGDRIHLRLPHRLVHDAQGNLALSVDPRYPVPAGVGTEVRVILDGDGDIVAGPGFVQFDDNDNVIVTNRFPCPGPYEFPSLAYTGYNCAFFPVATGSRRTAIAPIRKSDLRTKMKDVTRRWTTQHNGLRPSQAFKQQPMTQRRPAGQPVRPSAGSQTKGSQPTNRNGAVAKFPGRATAARTGTTGRTGSSTSTGRIGSGGFGRH